MKETIALLFIIFIMCCSAFAQSRLGEFDKAREIKLLESTRADVRKIFADFKSDADEEDNKVKDAAPIYSETFSDENADIEIHYSTGDCSDESENTDEWNVSKGKVKSIEISLDKPIKLKKFRFDVSDFLKEQRYANIEDSYVYHNKNLGIAFDVNDGKIETIHLFPTNSYYSSLCENEEAAQTKEFYSTESFFGNRELKDRVVSNGDSPANVTDLTLSADEITIGCANAAKNENCSNDKTEISVITEAVDPENDVLVYEYTVSGGTIVGSGAKVVWDLTGVETGTYTITAGVDDGCGICGQTQTKTVVIKEKSATVEETKLTDTQKQLSDEEIHTSDREKQLSDKEKHSSDTKKQLTDEKKQPSDEEKQLSDEKKQVTDEEKQLFDRKKQLTDAEKHLFDTNHG